MEVDCEGDTKLDLDENIPGLREKIKEIADQVMHLQKHPEGMPGKLWFHEEMEQ